MRCVFLPQGKNQLFSQITSCLNLTDLRKEIGVREIKGRTSTLKAKERHFQDNSSEKELFISELFPT